MRRRRSLGGAAFSPRKLFADGTVGAWYDPSDISTLFTDTSGTTPVTASGDPVGLMLDKSQGLVLGSELVTGAASAYSGNGTVATVGDTITATCTTNGIYGITWVSTSVSNLWALLTVEVVTNSASKSLLIFPNGNSTALAGGTTTGSKSFIALAPTATGSTARPIFYINGLVGESFSIRLASIKSYAGNHAKAANNSTSRPIYTVSGGLKYLEFDGTDDSFSTNSINFSATDKMSVAAGVRKLSDAAAGLLFELSANSASNLGTFGIFAPGSAVAEYTFQCSGSSLAARRATTYASPVTNVLFAAFDNAQSTTDTEVVPRINGATPTLTNIIGPAGTGNFTNTALFIGRRNNATFPFNGRLYQMIVCGKTLSASEVTFTEAYVNSKTGAY